MTAGAGSTAGAARIGPNAILQYLPVLRERVGENGLDDFLRATQIDTVPDGSAMIDEAEAARFHQAVRREFMDDARELAESAGTGTAEYIIAHRIPAFARRLLAILPRPLAERMLCRAISAHAWTFTGSGIFSVHSRSPITFDIAANPVVRDEQANKPICDWHAAVFQRLFVRLVGGAYSVREIQCCACGNPTCRFELRRAE